MVDVSPEPPRRVASMRGCLNVSPPTWSRTRVRLRARTRPASKCSLRQPRRGSDSALSTMDPGVTDADKPLLFAPFQRLGDVPAGSGCRSWTRRRTGAGRGRRRHRHRRRGHPRWRAHHDRPTVPNDLAGERRRGARPGCVDLPSGLARRESRAGGRRRPAHWPGCWRINLKAHGYDVVRRP